jgi:sugar phosphate permease
MLTASNASGQLVFLPLLAWVVTAYSWRAAAALIALTAILVVVPIALVFLRTDPADVGLMPYGAVEPEPPRRLVNPVPKRGRRAARRGARCATSGCWRERSSSAARPPTA